MWKTCDVSRSKATSPSSLSARSCGGRPRPGTATKKSSSRAPRSWARWTSMKPPPPGPVSVLSATQEAKPAATQASTAFPPAARTRAPVSAVTWWPAAIAPLINPSVTPHPRATFGRCSFNETRGAFVDPRREADARRRRDPVGRAARGGGRGGAPRVGRAARLRWPRARPAGLALGRGGRVPRRAPLQRVGLALRDPALRRTDRPRARRRLLRRRLAREHRAAGAGRRRRADRALLAVVRPRTRPLLDSRERVRRDRSGTGARARRARRGRRGARRASAVAGARARRARGSGGGRRLVCPRPARATARGARARRIPGARPV